MIRTFQKKEEQEKELRKKWSNFLIKSEDTPKVSLTKQQIFSYYMIPEVKKALLEQFKNRNILIYQKFDLETTLLRRNAPSGKALEVTQDKDDVEDENDYRYWIERDAIEFHPEITEKESSKTDIVFVDIDPRPGIDFEEVKNVAERCEKLISDIEEVQSVKVYFSGSRGFHVVGQLKKAWDILEAKGKIQETLKGMVDKEEKLVFSAPKKAKNRIVLDISLMKERGSLRAIYSLDKDTGLIKVPIRNIEDFELEDAKIEKVFGKIELKQPIRAEKHLEDMTLEEFKDYVVEKFEENKDIIKKHIQKLVPEIKVMQVWLSGSYAKGTQKEESDIDITILYYGDLEQEQVLQKLWGNVFIPGVPGMVDVGAIKNAKDYEGREASNKEFDKLIEYLKIKNKSILAANKKHLSDWPEIWKYIQEKSKTNNVTDLLEDIEVVFTKRPELNRYKDMKSGGPLIYISNAKDEAGLIHEAIHYLQDLIVSKKKTKEDSHLWKEEEFEAFFEEILMFFRQGKTEDFIRNRYEDLFRKNYSGKMLEHYLDMLNAGIQKAKEKLKIVLGEIRHISDWPEVWEYIQKRAKLMGVKDQLEDLIVHTNALSDEYRGWTTKPPEIFIEGEDSASVMHEAIHYLQDLAIKGGVSLVELPDVQLYELDAFMEETKHRLRQGWDESDIVAWFKNYYREYLDYKEGRLFLKEKYGMPLTDKAIDEWLEDLIESAREQIKYAKLILKKDAQLTMGQKILKLYELHGKRIYDDELFLSVQAEFLDFVEFAINVMQDVVGEYRKKLEELSLSMLGYSNLYDWYLGKINALKQGFRKINTSKDTKEKVYELIIILGIMHIFVGKYKGKYETFSEKINSEISEKILIKYPDLLELLRSRGEAFWKGTQEVNNVQIWERKKADLDDWMYKEKNRTQLIHMLSNIMAEFRVAPFIRGKSLSEISMKELAQVYKYYRNKKQEKKFEFVLKKKKKAQEKDRSKGKKLQESKSFKFPDGNVFNLVLVDNSDWENEIYSVLLIKNKYEIVDYDDYDTLEEAMEDYMESLEVLQEDYEKAILAKETSTTGKILRQDRFSFKNKEIALFLKEFWELYSVIMIEIKPYSRVLYRKDFESREEAEKDYARRYQELVIEEKKMKEYQNLINQEIIGDTIISFSEFNDRGYSVRVENKQTHEAYYDEVFSNYQEAIDAYRKEIDAYREDYEKKHLLIKKDKITVPDYIKELDKIEEGKEFTMSLDQFYNFWKIVPIIGEIVNIGVKLFEVSSVNAKDKTLVLKREAKKGMTHKLTMKTALKQWTKEQINKMSNSMLVKEHNWAHRFFSMKKKNPKWGKKQGWTIAKIKRIHDWIASRLKNHNSPMK